MTDYVPSAVKSEEATLKVVLRRNVDLILAMIFTLLAFAAAAQSWWEVFRVPLALAVTFFLPGYALLAALYPGRQALDGQARLLLSMGLSWAIVPLLSLAMNYLWSLEPVPVMAAAGILVLLLAGVAWVRRSRLAEYAPAASEARPLIEADYPFVLWAAVLILSVLMLVGYPIIISLDTSAIQSLNIFADINLFAVIFVAWLGMLLYLLFGHRDTTGWGRLGLVGVFALVFIGFWVFISPLGYHVDSLWHEGMVRTLQATGRLPDARYSYWNFPGVHLFTNFLSQVSGLSIIVTANVIRVSQNVLAAVLLYLVFARVLKSAYLASLAAVIAVMGVPVADHLQLIPHNFALVLLVAALVVLTQRSDRVLPTVPDKIAALLLLMAVNISSFWHTMVLAAVVAAVYLTQFFSRQKVLGTGFVALAAIITVAWQYFYARTTYQDLSLLLPGWWANIASGSFLNTTIMSAGTWGAQVPLWASLTRYFWLILVVVLGSALALIMFLRLRLLNVLERLAAGSVLATALFFVVVTVLSREGYYASRYQEFARLFTPAVLISFFRAPVWPWTRERWDTGRKWQIGFLSLGVILVAVLALPTFLLGGRSISGDAMATPDTAAGSFLESRFGTGDDVVIYSNQSFAGGIRYYSAPNSEGVGPLEPYQLKTADAIWPEMDRVASEFRAPGSQSKAFVYSERAALAYLGWFDVHPDDARWASLKDSLAAFVGPGNVWQNEYYTIYIHP